MAVPVEHLQFYYQKYYKKVGVGIGGGRGEGWVRRVLLGGLGFG